MGKLVDKTGAWIEPPSDGVEDAVERFRKWVEDGAPGGWLYLNTDGVHAAEEAESNRATVLPAVLDELERLQTDTVVLHLTALLDKADQRAVAAEAKVKAAIAELTEANPWQTRVERALASINPSREGE